MSNTRLEDVMSFLEEVCGKAWYKNNKKRLAEKLEPMLAEAPPVLDHTLKVKNQQLEELNTKLQTQLGETIEANTINNSHYMEAFGALIDIYGGLVGEETMMAQAPLTTVTLHKLIMAAISTTRSVNGYADVMTWVKQAEKHLTISGAGPLASGRFEGAKDMLVRVKSMLRSKGVSA